MPNRTKYAVEQINESIIAYQDLFKIRKGSALQSVEGRRGAV